MKEPKYKIGDRVYYVTPESPVGIIIDIRYFYSNGLFEYLVAFNYDSAEWCDAHELSESKVWQ